ncbi:DUF1513 domain-containing protein [Reinekea forsetii]|nr:DUF1513 domain-containing protein [Reinekea forsetii]
MTVISRRAFLRQGSALALAAPLKSLAFANATTNTDELIIGASRLGSDHFAISAVNLDGALQWQLPLPGRGHDIALHPNLDIGIAIARRPGSYLQLFSSRTGQDLGLVRAGNQLKLNGHACWVNNKLIVSASHRVSSQMCLLSYELTENQLVEVGQQFFDYIGPHEIAFAANAVWVAVGGLKTKGREVTNKNSLTSCVLQLSPNNLKVEKVFPAPFAGLSLRHLAFSEHETLYVAGQYQLDPNNSPPLLFALKNETLTPLKAPPSLWAQLKGYIGSVGVSEGMIVATSPRAHWLGWFAEHNFELTDQFLLPDVCALAATSQGLFAGSGTGRVYNQGDVIPSKIRWDNHFSAT